jgi:hypothetical protein
MPLQQIYSNSPIGTVLSFAGSVAPNGYLVCNGQSVAVVDYPDLYAVIGNIYGGDDANFNVPNLVDKFIQGSTTSGTEKEAGLPNITGINGAIRLSNTTSEPYGAFYRDRTASYAGNEQGQGSTISFDASRSNAIYGNSDTVQPPALTMIYIIKAKYTNEGTDVNVVLDDNVINHIDNLLVSELKTSSNVGQTNITMSETNAIASSGGHGCRYVVRNGICYVNMDLRMIANGRICTLPAPLMTVINIPMIIFMTDLTDVGNNNGVLIIESNGSATTLGAKLNQTRYMLNFSYPIA